jgi:hypothetical protein
MNIKKNVPTKGLFDFIKKIIPQIIRWPAGEGLQNFY